GRLAPFAVPAVVQPALAVFLPGMRAVPVRHCDDDVAVAGVSPNWGGRLRYSYPVLRIARRRDRVSIDAILGIRPDLRRPRRDRATRPAVRSADGRFHA